MDKHIEECICYVESCCPWMGECNCQCICDILRACERRVAMERNLAWNAECDLQMVIGYAAALDAAREAVAAMPLTGGWTTPDGVIEEIDKAKAVAAIDALREEKK